MSAKLSTRQVGDVSIIFRLAACFSRLMPSRASRLAVRFSEAAFAAFFARATRCSGVMFFAAFLPPCLPNWRAISVIAARSDARI